jgi:hypothetical protein
MANESSLNERERQDQEKAEDNKKRQIRLGVVAPKVEEAPKAAPKKRSRAKSKSS